MKETIGNLLLIFGAHKGVSHAASHVVMMKEILGNSLAFRFYITHSVSGGGNHLPILVTAHPNGSTVLVSCLSVFYMDVSKNRGFSTKMDGENNGKPY